jgi:hypothetical protein
MEHELGKLKRLIVFLVLLIVGCFFAYEELIYFVAGGDAAATVTKVSDVTVRRRWQETTRRQVEFSFVESNGTRRNGMDAMSASWTPPSTGDIQVRYTPGADGRARIAGNVNWIGVGLFAVMMCIVLVLGIRFYLKVCEETKPLQEETKRYEYE